MKYLIKYNVTPPTKTFEVNLEEELYFKTFYSKLTNVENQKIILYRFSDGAIEPYFNNYPLGKIKLQGKKHYLQILKSLYKYEVVEGFVKDFINRIDDVVLYLRKYLKK